MEWSSTGIGTEPSLISYFNDLDTGLSSNILKFADDRPTKIFCPIMNHTDGS